MVRWVAETGDGASRTSRVANLHRSGLLMGRRAVLLVVAIVIAAVGATLVFLYVQGINSRAIADQEPVKVLTVTSPIALGETVASAQQAGKLQLKEMPSASVLPGALTSTASISGDVALSAIYPGEQVLAAKFGSAAAADTSALSIPPNMLAISVQLDDPGRVAGFVTPGSHVAIFVSLDPTAAGSSGGAAILTRLLIRDVEVIGVGQTTVSSSTKTAPSGSQTTEETPQTILTVGVSQADADKVIFSSKNGTLSFGLLPKGTRVKSDPGVTISNLFK
jgi:pilus assembly protein CpaB